jgi:hypothetical protein
LPALVLATDLGLPPPFRLVTLREAGCAHAHAVAIAAAAGAGTLVRVGRADTAELALVLEPEPPLRTARCVLYLAMNALADALATWCPPEKPLTFAWPTSLRVDGATVGGADLAWPPGAGEDEPPAWLVVSAEIRLAARRGTAEPGRDPTRTTLAEEGFAPLAPADLVAAFARHLLLGLDTWGERGFAPLAERYLARLEPEPAGRRRGLAPDGDLLVRAAAGGPRQPAAEGGILQPAAEGGILQPAAEGGVERRSLVAALGAGPAWR